MGNNFDKIPEELRQLNQWVCWNKEIIDGKETKIPYQPSGKKASSTDNATWSSFNNIVSLNGKFSGIGFIFSKDDPYCFVDLDHCIDENGCIEPDSKAIIDKLNSYTEISQSGTGVHVIVKASLPEGSGNRKGNFEIYAQGRYCAMTGNVLQGYPLSIEERQEQVNQICLEIFGKPEPEPSKRKPSITNLTDDEIIEKASNAKNGLKFKLLMAGDISGYGSGSEADLALVDMIAFYSQDRGQILRIIEQSALYDKKWQRVGYQQRTIDKALSNLSGAYQPGGNGKSSISRAVDPVTTEGKKADTAKYFSDKVFIPARLANELMAKYDFIYCSGELYIYQNGVYKPYGVEFIRQECYKMLCESARINHVNEVIANIQYTSLIEADKLNTYNQLINLENGMYDIKNDKLLAHSKDYLSTVRIPVKYDPNASYANISDWLSSTLADPDAYNFPVSYLAIVLFLIPQCLRRLCWSGPGQMASQRS